jgi:hypothetical protein
MGGIEEMKYLLLTAALVLAACSSTPPVEPAPVVEVRTFQVPRPAPIVPSVDQLTLRPVNWIIVTPENVDEVFTNLRGEKALFAVTSDGYEALALNLSDVRAMVQQQQRIIAIYRQNFR